MSVSYRQIAAEVETPGRSSVHRRITISVVNDVILTVENGDVSASRE